MENAVKAAAGSVLSAMVSAVVAALVVTGILALERRDWRMTADQKLSLARAIAQEPERFSVKIFPIAGSRNALTLSSDLFEQFQNQKRPAELFDASNYAGIHLVGAYVAVATPDQRETNEKAKRFKAVFDGAVVKTGRIRTDARLSGDQVGIVIGERP